MNNTKQPKTKYFKETGIILNFCEIRIDKPTKAVKYSHREYKVIISNDKQYVVENNYGSLETIDKIASKYYSDRAVNKVSVHEQKWGSKYLEDYIYSKCVSTFSEQVTKNRVKKALLNFIDKESYFYRGLEQEIENQLKKNLTV